MKITSIPQQVTMTKEGGFYYRMSAVFYLSIAISFIPIFLMLVVTLLNPLWFRDDLLIWFQNKVENFAQWRNRLLYRVYLGTDPEVWHALKDGSSS